MNFNSQLNQNQNTFLEEFNKSIHLSALREHYKNNFEEITHLIAKFRPKGAVEDILEMNSSLPPVSPADRLLIQQINLGISNKTIVKNSLI